MLRASLVLSLVGALCLLGLNACGQQSSSSVRGLSPAEFAEMSRQKVVVLDVRTPAEYKEGHLAQAQPLNFYDKPQVEARVADLDPSQTYLIYCTVGQRSHQMAELMARRGFAQIYHLEGGLQAWQKAGYPITQ